jgi:hypothetical protein
MSYPGEYNHDHGQNQRDFFRRGDGNGRFGKEKGRGVLSVVRRERDKGFRKRRPAGDQELYGQRRAGL